MWHIVKSQAGMCGNPDGHPHSALDTGAYNYWTNDWNKSAAGPLYKGYIVCLVFMGIEANVSQFH